ncbi:hypothetical protein FPV67DRAFT_195307 [Lyophyllum atratum]|nr:hypothetical protein FPV67DRAFT_195307 [Lyophyllum atratum]
MRDLNLRCQLDTFCYVYNPYDRRLEKLDAEDYDIPGTQVRQSLHYSKGVQTLCLISTMDIDRGMFSARVAQMANGNNKKAGNTTLTSRFIDATTRRLRSALPSAKQRKIWKATLPSRLKSLATRHSRPLNSTPTDSGSDPETEPFLQKGATDSLFFRDDDVSTTSTTEEDTKVWVAPPNSLGGSVTLHCIESPIYAHLDDQEKKLGFKAIETCFLPEDSDGIAEIQNFLLHYPVHTLYGYNPITEEFIDFYDHHKREIDVDRLQRCLWYPEDVLDDRSVTICFVSTVDEKRHRDREYQAMDTSSEARVVSRLLNGLASIPTCMSTLRVDGTQMLPLWWGFFLSRIDEVSGIRGPKVVAK